MIKAEVNYATDIELPDKIDFSKLNRIIDDNVEKIATFIRDDAKATTAFTDKTGKLRKSIRIRKSKFEDGGYIVQSKAPHAHLVELGHDLIKNGKKIGRVKEHPFLRPAKEKAIKQVIKVFQQGEKL